MPLRVTDPLAIRLLLKPDMAVSLKPFMEGPKAVKDLALAQGLSPKQAYYRVGLFLRAGLLKEVDRVPRSGRLVRRYQAVERDFLIPPSLIPPRLLQALEEAESWKKEWEKALAPYAFGQGDFRVFLNPEGILEFGWAEEPDILEETFPPVLNLWSAGLYLSRSEAKALQRELVELYHRYAALTPARKAEGQGRYLLHLGLAPAP